MLLFLLLSATWNASSDRHALLFFFFILCSSPFARRPCRPARKSRSSCFPGRPDSRSVTRNREWHAGQAVRTAISVDESRLISCSNHANRATVHGTGRERTQEKDNEKQKRKESERERERERDLANRGSLGFWGICATRIFGDD